jgi:hypothetical protein
MDGGVVIPKFLDQGGIGLFVPLHALWITEAIPLKLTGQVFFLVFGEGGGVCPIAKHERRDAFVNLAHRPGGKIPPHALFLRDESGRSLQKALKVRSHARELQNFLELWHHFEQPIADGRCTRIRCRLVGTEDTLQFVEKGFICFEPCFEVSVPRIGASRCLFHTTGREWGSGVCWRIALSLRGCCTVVGCLTLGLPSRSVRVAGGRGSGCIVLGIVTTRANTGGHLIIGPGCFSTAAVVRCIVE